MWAGIKHVLKPRGAVLLFGSQPFTSALVMSNLEWFKYEIILNKTRPTGFIHAKNKILKIHENISVFSSGTTVHKSQSNNRMTFNPQMQEGKPYVHVNKPDNLAWIGKTRPSWRNHLTVNNGNRYPTSVVKFPNSNHGSLHPTQKPVAFMEYLIKTYTNPGETVFDFVMGSGTTGAAAMRTGRDFIGIELDQDYFHIAETRIKNAAGEFVITDKERAMGQMALFGESDD